MKKLLVTAFVAIAATFTAKAQNATPQQPVNPNVAEISFDKETHDFGVIPQGTPASYTFTVHNKGKAPLIITNASASCGCTTPDWTKKPLNQEEKDLLKLHIMQLRQVLL